MLGALLELARRLLIEVRKHQAFVTILLGLGLGRGIQNELRDFAKALRLLLLHETPPPLWRYTPM